MTRVLVVEDEESFREALEFMLSKEGFEVALAATGTDALVEFERSGADLILLDLMLPGMSGTEVCRTIRAKSKVPIIMVTAKADEVDKVVGLEIGADDYVTKPFSSRELVARIRAVLRRNADFEEEPVVLTLEVGPVRLDTERHKVSVRGEAISLPLKEFDLLELLMQQPGTVISRDTIYEAIWGYNFETNSKSLDVYIGYLRRKTEEGTESRVVYTVRGVGYTVKAS